MIKTNNREINKQNKCVHLFPTHDNILQKLYVSLTIQLLYEYHKGSTLNYWVEVLKYIFTR